MSTILSNRQATFKILDKMENCRQFSGVGLQLSVSRKTGKKPFISSCLRYMRVWRDLHPEIQIICIDKFKSVYEVRRK